MARTENTIIISPENRSALAPCGLLQPQPKRPLQCVTLKMPLPQYLRNKRAAQRWNMTYTEVINFRTQKIVQTVESPSGRIAEKLEQHRQEGERRKTQRPPRCAFLHTVTTDSYPNV
jgi:hypothetical protein